MPNYGIFTNFFFQELIENEEKIREKISKKVEKAAVRVAIQFLYVATQNSSGLKEICHSQQLNVTTKLKHNSRLDRVSRSRP